MRMQMSSMGLVQSDGNMCDVSPSARHCFCVQSRVTHITITLEVRYALGHSLGAEVICVTFR